MKTRSWSKGNRKEMEQSEQSLALPQPTSTDFSGINFSFPLGETTFNPLRNDQNNTEENLGNNNDSMVNVTGARCEEEIPPHVFANVIVGQTSETSQVTNFADTREATNGISTPTTPTVEQPATSSDISFASLVALLKELKHENAVNTETLRQENAANAEALKQDNSKIREENAANSEALKQIRQENADNIETLREENARNTAELKQSTAELVRKEISGTENKMQQISDNLGSLAEMVPKLVETVQHLEEKVEKYKEICDTQIEACKEACAEKIQSATQQLAIELKQNMPTEEIKQLTKFQRQQEVLNNELLARLERQAESITNFAAVRESVNNCAPLRRTTSDWDQESTRVTPSDTEPASQNISLGSQSPQKNSASEFDVKYFVSVQNFKRFKDYDNSMHPKMWLEQFEVPLPDSWPLKYKLSFMCGYLEGDTEEQMREIAGSCKTLQDFKQGFLEIHWSKSLQNRIRQEIATARNFEASGHRSLIKYFEHLLKKNQFLDSPFSAVEIIRICHDKLPKKYQQVLVGKCSEGIQEFKDLLRELETAFEGENSNRQARRDNYEPEWRHYQNRERNSQGDRRNERGNFQRDNGFNNRYRGPQNVNFERKQYGQNSHQHQGHRGQRNMPYHRDNGFNGNNGYNRSRNGNQGQFNRPWHQNYSGNGNNAYNQYGRENHRRNSWRDEHPDCRIQEVIEVRSPNPQNNNNQTGQRQ